MTGRRQIIIITIVAALSVTAAVLYGVTYGPLAPGPRAEGERSRGFTEILDADRRVLLRTGLSVAIGDELITSGDALYRVRRVLGRTAIASLISKGGASEPDTSGAAPAQTRPTPGNPTPTAPDPAVPGPVPARPIPTPPVITPLAPVPSTAAKTIVVYSTHSDESYTPDDGTPIIPGNGSIYEVGTTFATALRAKGFVVVDDPTRHDPHDNQAYIRSRRTAYQGIQMYRPVAIFDIHRDSAPASDYVRAIDNEQVQQVMIVVGRQNLTMAANLQVAKQIKATADSLYPGLIKAIFMGRGLYNQDLMPTALLFEFGTETAPRAGANNAARLMADVITKTFGPATP